MTIFTLLMAIRPVKPPCILTIIARGAQLVILVVLGHGGRREIFGILENRHLSNPFRKSICVLLRWVTTRDIYL